MARDPLDALIRLRRLALEEAMRELGARLAEEAEAIAAVARIEASIAAEQAAASRLDTGDAAVEGFGRWLRRIGQERAAAAAARDRTEIETTRSRAGTGCDARGARRRGGGGRAPRRTGADRRHSSRAGRHR